MNTTFDLEDLKTVMRRCTGTNDASSLDGDITNVRFRDLGYDSLAVLEIASNLQRAYRIAFSDEAIEQMVTPADVLQYLNTAKAA